ncbi:hypothetical protein EDC94DRAFT_598067 [Helicostylum pulchrum]|nr:hypothetical protein EDC94DRAFT_598067 [Helicostylum pulchrum]
MAITLYQSSKSFMICYLEIIMSSTGYHFVILISAFLYTITMFFFFFNSRYVYLYKFYYILLYINITSSYCILMLFHHNPFFSSRYWFQYCRGCKVSEILKWVLFEALW